MASNRWVAIDPDILTHPLVGAAQAVPPADKSRGAYSRMESWVWLICNASFVDHTVNNRGRKMTLKRGDLLGGWLFLATTWNWTPKTVRAWVEKPIGDDMLRKRAVELQIDHNWGREKEGTQHGNYYGNQTQILTVVNYWRFQFEGYERGQPTGQEQGQPKGNQRPTKGQHITKEQGNKGTEILTHRCTPTPEHVPPGEGYTPLPHSAWLNGESIWHPKFTISIASAKMQFALANLGDIDVVATCKAAAIQWAAEIEGGKPAEKVVPGNIIGAIIGGVRKGTYSAHEHQVRLAKAAANQPAKTFRR